MPVAAYGREAQLESGPICSPKIARPLAASRLNISQTILLEHGFASWNTGQHFLPLRLSLILLALQLHELAKSISIISAVYNPNILVVYASGTIC